MKRFALFLLVVAISLIGFPAGAADESSVPTDDFRQMNLLDAQGKKQSFASLRRPVTFFVFWATWCPPCLRELKDVGALARQLAKDKQVRVLAVNVDGADASAISLTKVLRARTTHLPLYRDPESQLLGNVVSRSGQAVGLPMVAVLDKNDRLSTELGYAMIPQKEQLAKWKAWIEGAKRGEVPKREEESSDELPDELPDDSPKPGPVASQSEIFNMEAPTDLPEAELNRELESVRQVWLKRYPHLSPAQVESLLGKARAQIKKSGWVELEVPGPED